MPGRTRVTLLSPRAARIEHAASGEFIDGPSFFFCQRRDSVPWPHIEREGETETFRSDFLDIRLRRDRPVDSPEGLEIRWRVGDQSGVWHPGDIDRRNLGGPFSAADNLSRLITAEGVHEFDPLVGLDARRCSTHDICRAIEAELRLVLGRHPESSERNEELRRLVAGKRPRWLPDFSPKIRDTLARVRRFPPGFLTRDGLTVIRDTGPLWDAEQRWIRPRPEGHLLDLTVIACGHDFKGTLGEIARLAGPIPMLPRFVLGVWFSCYRRMGTREFQRLAAEFERNDLPLDVVVVDTDWHREFWQGFDWNTDLFPDPQAFFDWLRREGLHTTLNVHPGFLPESDSHAEEFRRVSGSRAKPHTRKTAPHRFFVNAIPVDFRSRPEVRAWFDVLHRPIEEMGCDFWWIDGASPHWDGEESTVWLNHIYHQHLEELGDRRPLAFSRASGLGVHRTTLAFSGDALSQWESLAQEVEMTVRGANALVCHWSHDIGGFAKGQPEWPENRPPDDLYLRWVQFGALSPVMRFHSDHGVREPWLFAPGTCTLVREALHLRMRLVPTLYTLAHEAHDTGVGPWRPMCHEFPREEEAYHRWRQAMIGESLLFAPVTDPDGQAEIWFPPGRWHRLQTREVFEGPAVSRWKAQMGEIPLFLRGGYALALAPPVKRTRELANSHLEIVAPEPVTHALRICEDDGVTRDFERGAFRWIQIDIDAERGALGVEPPEESERFRFTPWAQMKA